MTMMEEQTTDELVVVHKEMRKEVGYKDKKHIITVEPLCGAPESSGECLISFYWKEVTCKRCRKLRMLCNPQVH